MADEIPELSGFLFFQRPLPFGTVITIAFEERHELLFDSRDPGIIFCPLRFGIGDAKTRPVLSLGEKLVVKNIAIGGDARNHIPRIPLRFKGNQALEVVQFVLPVAIKRLIRINVAKKWAVAEMLNSFPAV